jgi:uncharacterized phage-associated protein
MPKIDYTHRKPPQLVSDQILWLRRSIATTPMHVLKLVYLCHGWALGLHDLALIHEPVEAWRYGPVVPSVYHTYKSFRGNAINAPAVDRSSEFSAQQMDAIELVHDVYSDFDAIQLSALTHRPGTPWDITRKKYGLGTPIPDELILEHFKEL